MWSKWRLYGDLEELRKSIWSPEKKVDKIFEFFLRKSAPPPIEKILDPPLYIIIKEIFSLYSDYII